MSNNQSLKLRKTLFAFFKKKDSGQSSSGVPCDVDDPKLDEQPASKSRRVEAQCKNIASLEWDPKLRKPIWTYLVNQQDDVRKMYINMGPYQPKLEEFPPLFDGQQFRRFQYTWYAQFPWLEYSK